ncbi:MAG: ABC transporter permease [Verrucomicrobia bacterium]|nr:ABC transporter permease [Verrucomicrobiota bacterium]
MRFLPIVERELRVAARRRGTYWLRSGVALGVIVAAAWIFLMSLREPPREVGQILFLVLTAGLLIYCWLAGARSTADCLSEEKREGTLGLLFLTDLKGYDVVMGKLVANSLNAFYGVLAVVPVLGIPLLLGGVTVGEFGRVAAVLVNTLFFSLCAGMFASAVSRKTPRAVGGALGILLLFTAGAPALGAWFSWIAKVPDLALWFFRLSPVTAYLGALDRTFSVRPEAFYWSLASIHAVAWLLLLLASLVAPRAWQDRPAGAHGVRWREHWHLWWHGDAAERRAFRDQLLDRNPFLWLAARPRLKPLWTWGFLGLVGCVWTWGILRYQSDWFNEGIFAATALLFNTVLKGSLASEAGRQLTEDRRMGALELLLSTPLRVPEILRGQRLALQRQFLGPVLVVLGAEFLMVTAGANHWTTGGDRPLWLWLGLAVMIMLVADLIALYWVGMWMGLASQNPRRAFSGAATRILVLPWIAFALFLMLVALAPSELQTKLDWGHFIAVWFALGLAADIGFGVWARHKLLHDFRLVATQRFEPQRPWWKSLLAGDSKSGDVTSDMD